MDELEQRIGKVTGFLDRIAGLALLAVMLLIVVNIILRATGLGTILGAYEYVGFISVVVIALSLAHCAYQNGHISVDFIIAKLPDKAKLPIDLIIYLLSVVFLALASYHVYQYGVSMIQNGLVSPTTQTHFYYYVFIAALGLLALCFVFLVRMLKLMQKVKINE